MLIQLTKIGNLKNTRREFCSQCHRCVGKVSIQIDQGDLRVGRTKYCSLKRATMMMHQLVVLFTEFTGILTSRSAKAAVLILLALGVDGNSAKKARFESVNTTPNFS
ncbi:hypothetical protein T03_9944 [Trichinella britovi]|uniref:Uncharacterized protein n=2 Tax=Trichinella TaxID=6333 RepID=A0A0V1CDJ3_TRIBR|nr:hypothetical protein T05_5757 [Trichinella murrelli]KRX64505.1 hypothetical protein T09_3840 [Trichinella sp. T9]KRY46803.1 hypothetical protein T03_9944 [Trichinella britovi]KRZ87464.1 hypothetical protein T08_609 [Trichinella sp. T8]